MNHLKLDFLVGERVELTAHEGVLVISGGERGSIFIYNKYTLEPEIIGSDNGEINFSATMSSVKYLIGVRAVFAFDNGVSVSVDLSASAHFGPESMQLRGPRGEIVVWR